MFKFKSHIIILFFLALSVMLWSVVWNQTSQDVTYAASVSVEGSEYSWSLDPIYKPLQEVEEYRIDNEDISLHFKNDSKRSLSVELGKDSAGPTITYRDPEDEGMFGLSSDQNAMSRSISLYHESAENDFDMSVVRLDDQIIYQSDDGRKTDIYRYNNDYELKNTTIYHYGDGAEEERYSFDNIVLHKRKDGTIGGYYLENIDLSGQADTEEVDQGLLARASKFLAQERINDLHKNGGLNPDFTIPTPFVLDKDNNKLFVFYEITGDSFNQLTIRFYTNPSQYPLLLDPTLEFTAPGASTASDTIDGEASSAFGYSLATGDLDADSDIDLVVAAREYSGAIGRVYIFYSDGAIPTTAATADVIITGGAAGNYFGAALTTGDLNGDTYTDLAVGAYGYDPDAAANTGRAYVFYSNGDGTFGDSGGAGTCTTDCNVTDDADVVITGEAISNYFGWALVTGDLDNDTDTDLAIVARGYNSNQGRVYVFYNGNLTSSMAADTDADVIITGEAVSNYIYTLAIGDFDNDTDTDLVVSAWNANSKGRAYIFYNDGTTSLGSSCSGSDPTLCSAAGGDVIIEGVASTRFGYSLTTGDLDGVNGTDLAVGAYLYNSFQGRVYVFYSNGDGTFGDSGGAGTCTTDCNVTDDADVIITGETSPSADSEFGYILATGDLNGDGATDLVVGAGGYSSSQGRVYVFYNGNIITEDASDADVIITGESASYFANSLGSPLVTGDMNADGMTDLIIGAYQYGGGRAYIFYGGGPLVHRNTITGEATGDYFGTGEGFSTAVGDLDNDGDTDLAVGAMGYNSAQGRVYIFYNDGSYTSAAGSADVIITGESANNSDFGRSLTTGDLNDDNKTDLAVGANSYSLNYKGRAYVFYNDGSYPSSAADADVIITADADYTELGWSLGTGDLNDDNKTDLVVGACGYPEGDYTGRAYIFYNEGSGTFLSCGTDCSDNTDADVIIDAGATYEEFGDIFATGDLNDDGKTDLAVGAYGYNSGQGRAYIFYNEGSGTFLSCGVSCAADTDADVIITGETSPLADSEFGHILATGDLNDDNKTDLAVGANSYSTYTGRAYVFYNDGTVNFGTQPCSGTPALCDAQYGDVIIEGEATYSEFGISVTTLDQNMDGDTDLAVGAYGYDGSHTNEGRAYIFYNDGSYPSSAADADITITGEAGTYFGNYLTSGDLDDDGDEDLVASSENYNSNQGRIYIYYSNPLFCGDGSIWGSEVCDDGNTSGDDGCEADCLSITSGYGCAGEPSVCQLGTTPSTELDVANTAPSFTAGPEEKTWSSQTSGVTTSLQGVAFIDEDTGWMVDSSGNIRNTVDGGTNWSHQTNVGTPLLGVFFVNGVVGFAVGGSGSIFKYNGSSWSSQTSGVPSITLNDVYCFNATTCWIVGNSGTILITINGGTNWDPPVGGSGTGLHLRGVHFANINNGWAVGVSGVIRKTTDGGDNWTTSDSGTTSTLRNVHFVSSTTGWAVGQNGTIVKTTNGGTTTWSTQTSGLTSEELRDVYSVSTTTVWAVASSGDIINTTDGGTNWVKQVSGTSLGLWDVYFADADTGWAVGNNGTILKGVTSSSDITPTNAGDDVVFKAIGTDPNGDDYYLAVCTTSSVIPQNGTAPTCGVGTWGISGATTSGSEASASYTTTGSEGGVGECDAPGESCPWYAFVCDGKASLAACSAPNQGASPGGANNSSPFEVNHVPYFGKVMVSDQTGSPTQLLTNGNMETGNPPSDWYITPGATATSVADERTGGSGSQSMEVTRDDVNWWVANQSFTTVIGKTYRASGWIKNNFDADRATLVATKDDGSVVQESAVITSTSWTYTTFDFVAEDTTSRIFLSIGNDSGDTVWLDDVTVYEVDTIEPGDDVYFHLNTGGPYGGTKRMGGSNGDEGYDIAVDSDGNIYVTGSFYGTVDFGADFGASDPKISNNGDIFVTKINSGGTYGWTRRMGGDSGDYGYGIAVDTSGNTYVTGTFGDTVDFGTDFDTSDSKTAPGEDDDDIFVTKIDTNGGYGWTRRMGGIGSDYGNSIAVDTNGNTYVAGYFEDTVDFQADFTGGPDSKTASGEADVFVTKIDTNGDYGWTRQIGDGGDYSEGYGVAVDTSGNAYVTGIFSGTVDFGTDFGTSDSKTSDSGSDDIFVTKINSGGTYGWTRRMGGASTDAGNGVAVDTNGNTYVTGYFYGTVDFGADFGASDPKISNNGDIFVTKINSGGTYGWTRRMGGTGSENGYSIAVDTSGNTYVTGTFNGTADFQADFTGGPDSKTSNNNSVDIFVTKINSDGAYGWTRRMGGTSWDYGRGVTVDTNGNTYVTGLFRGTSVNFGADFGETDSKDSAGSNDIFVTHIKDNIIEDNDIGGAQDTVDVHICSSDTVAYDNVTDNRCEDGGGAATTLICEHTGFDPSTTAFECSNTTIADAPKAHGYHNFKVYVFDSHDFPGIGTETQTYTVEDVAPTLVSYSITSPTFPLSITADGSQAVAFTVRVNDDNGWDDVDSVGGVFFDDSSTGVGNIGEGTNTCDSTPANGGHRNCYTDTVCIESPLSQVDSTDVDAFCGVTVNYNANASADWEIHGKPTDGNGQETGLADSNDNNEIQTTAGIKVTAATSTINYGALAPDTASSGQTTSIGNVGNIVVDITIEGDDMCTDYDACSDTPPEYLIGKNRQEWAQSGGVGFTWGTGHTLLATSGVGTADANGCANLSMVVRGDAGQSEPATENENIFWKLKIPAVQELGTYNGANTVAVIANTACTGTP